MRTIKIGSFEVVQPCGLWWQVHLNGVAIETGLRKNEAIACAKRYEDKYGRMVK